MLAKERTARQITYLSHQQRAVPMVADSREKTAYYRIADHYRFVLSTLFECLRYPRVIILEVRALAELNRLHAVFVFWENISFVILQSTAEADSMWC